MEPNGSGSKMDIEGLCNEIRKQIEVTTSDYDREKLQERLAKPGGGVAVLEVGAATETEMKEKKARGRRDGRHGDVGRTVGERRGSDTGSRLGVREGELTCGNVCATR